MVTRGRPGGPRGDLCGLEGETWWSEGETLVVSRGETWWSEGETLLADYHETSA